MGDNRFAGIDADIEADTLVIKREMEGHDVWVLRKNRRRHLQIDRTIRIVRLPRRHVLDASPVEPAEPDRAVETQRRDRDVPVPAEMALRLAQHVAVGDGRIAGMVGNVEGLPGLLVGTRRDARLEDDADDILARLQLGADIGPVAAEAVVGEQHRRVVDEDGCHRVEIVDVEVPVAIRFRQQEAALENPVAVRHPLHRLLVAADIGIRNEARGRQRRVHIARQRDRRRDVAIGRGECPRAGKIDRGIGFRQGCHGFVRICRSMDDRRPAGIGSDDDHTRRCIDNRQLNR